MTSYAKKIEILNFAKEHGQVQAFQEYKADPEVSLKVLKDVLSDWQNIYRPRKGDLSDVDWTLLRNVRGEWVHFLSIHQAAYYGWTH